MAGIDWGLPGPRAGTFFGISDRGGQRRKPEEPPIVVFYFPGRSPCRRVSHPYAKRGPEYPAPFCVHRDEPGVYSRSSRLRTCSETKNEAAISTSQKTTNMANFLITFFVGRHFFGRQFAAVYPLPDPTHVGKENIPGLDLSSTIDREKSAWTRIFSDRGIFLEFPCAPFSGALCARGISCYK